MDFDLSEEQQMLADTVERLVRNTYGFERREAFYQSPEGYSPEFWRQLSELGISSVPISADYDGFGGSGIENMLVMKALGHGLCVEPYLYSQIYGAGLVQHLGTAEQRQRILPQVASGERRLAVADEESGSQHRMAEMRGELELARSMTILAACVADDPDSKDRSRRLTAAKHNVARSSQMIAGQSIQLHGGIGMTWEYVLAHHAKRLVMLTHQFGDDDYHLGQYSALLDLPRQVS